MIEIFNTKLFKGQPLHHHNFHEIKFGFIDRLFCKERNTITKFNQRMFDEDFAGIFNYSSRKRNELFNISSNDDELTHKLLSSVQKRYSSYSVDEEIIEWSKQIAQSLIETGVAYYFLYDSSESEEIHLMPFGPSGILGFFGTWVQWVPKRTERHWQREDEELAREIRILESAKVMRFSMPKSIQRMLVAQNRILAALDKHQLGSIDFQPRSTHENPNPTNYFNFSVWKDSQDLALYRATRVTGWMGRKYDSTKRSDFFDCHRQIRFRRNQLKLRDNILIQLSAELSRVGRLYNDQYAMNISASDELPSIEHLDELERKLIREEVGFTEVIDYCFQR